MSADAQRSACSVWKMRTHSGKRPAVPESGNRTVAQTGGRTIPKLLPPLDQIDLDHNVIFSEGKPDRRLIRACALTGLPTMFSQLEEEQADKSPFLFSESVKPDQPITTVKTAWTTTLKNAGVAHFPSTI